jgi:hypothetical protein
MGKRPHILRVELPGVAKIALEAGLAAVVAALGATTDVLITFTDGKVYEYPNVSVPLAFAVQNDPDGAFDNIRYWPGYRRIR